jgi:hypothetical protein
MTDDLGRVRDWSSLAQSRTDWNQFGAIFKKQQLEQHLELAHSRKNNSPLIGLDFDLSVHCPLRSLSEAPISRRKHPVLMSAKYLI